MYYMPELYQSAVYDQDEPDGPKGSSGHKREVGN